MRSYDRNAGGSFAAAGIDWRYLTLMVKPEALAAAVEE
jgi:hypothetical protein